LKKRQDFEVITGKRIEKWRLLISVMLVGSSVNSVKQWCREMKIKNKDLSAIMESVKSFENTRKNLSVRIADNSKLFKLIHNLPYELLVMIASENKVQSNNIERYLKKLSDIRLEITGENLKNLGYKPSREFKIVLEKLLDLKLDGKLKTMEDELERANKMLSSGIIS
jgi:tRNA nucleotidyltransferase (CCA-adding enzyme)